MTSRERTIAAIEFKSPDRVPVWHEYLSNFAWQHADFLTEMLTRYPGDISTHEEVSDVEAIPLKPCRGSSELMPGRTLRDDWGCVWQYEEPGMQGIVIDHPIKSYDDLKHYTIPDPHRVDFEAMRRRNASRAYQRYVWVWPPNFFHLLTFLLGYEKVVVDLSLGEQGLFELIDRIIKEHHVPHIEELCRVDCDGLFFGDDLGTQTQLMVSPSVWRRTLKPYYRQQFEIVKNAGKHVILHTDGYTLDIIPDLIEIGVDAMNPQHEIMESETLIPMVRGKLCILTDLDRQRILPFGTPEQVRQHVSEVKQKFWTPEGGLIFHGELAVDVPLGNIRAMYEAFDQLR